MNWLHRLQVKMTQDHSRRQHHWLLCTWLGWMLLWAIYYGGKRNEATITGDLVHQVTTALSRIYPDMYSKDYLYRDPETMAFYSPQQIWSIVFFYWLTASMAWSLAILQFLYSSVITVGAWLIARQLSRNIWVMAIMMAAMLQYAASPLNGGHSWGLLGAIYPTYSPMNWLLARGLVLIFLSFVIAPQKNTESMQALILGLTFTVHAPTGLTLSVGAVPYFLLRLGGSHHKLTDLSKWSCAFLLGASYFLWNYWAHAPQSIGHLSVGDKAFLYDFLQYRMPDDYPVPWLKLVLRSSRHWGWLAHVPLFAVTGAALYGLARRSGAVILSAMGMIIVYVFAIKGIPLAALIFFVAYRFRSSMDPNNVHAVWRIALVGFGAFFVCTWLEWASDIYYFIHKTPPLIIDNTRFLPFLFPMAAIVFFFVTQVNRYRIMLTVLFLMLSVPLWRTFFDPTYQNYADAHNIKWRAQYDFDPHFSLSGEDLRRVSDFAATTPKNSLFLFLDTKGDGWYFRLRAKRPIAINHGDLGWKYYIKKKELIDDWKDYLDILAAYRQRDAARLCDVPASKDADYVVFPKTRIIAGSCFAINKCFDNVMILSRKNRLAMNSL